MYVKRKRAFKKRYRRGPKNLRRAKKIIRKMRRQRKQQMIHVRCEIPQTFTTGPNVPTAFIGEGRSFWLDQITGNTNYKNLFQYYRINKVVLKFTALRDSVDMTDYEYKGVGVGAKTTSLSTGFLKIVKDYMDSNAPTGVAEMRSYPNTKTYNSTDSFSIVLRPALARPSYESSTSWGYTPQWKQWVRTDDPQVPHYGLKWCVYNEDLDADYTTILPRWRITGYYYISFKTPIPGYTQP